MKWFYLTPFSLAVFHVILLLSFMVFYLWRIREKSAATRQLILFLSGVWLVFFSFLFVFSSIHITYAVCFWWLLHTVVFATAAMVRFAYAFIENLHPKESIIAGKTAMVAACVIYPYYVLRTLFLTPTYSFDGHFYVFLNTPEIGILIGVEIVWVIALFLRKAAAFSETPQVAGTEGSSIRKEGTAGGKRLYIRAYLAAQRIVHANDKRAAAMRNFTLLFISPVILIVSLILAYQGLLSWEIVAHILGSGFVIVVFVFIVLYINYSAEPSTFMIKLMGICLGTVLITLGIAGQIALVIKGQAYDGERRLEKRYCRLAVQKNDFSELPESILYIASRSPGDHGRPEIVYQREESGDIGKRLEESRLLPVRSKPPGVDSPQHRYLPGEPADTYLILYTFTQNGRRYEIGYPYLDYRAYIHRSSRSIFLVAGGVVLFILLIFPVFFRESLIKPLNGLLDGVRRVNDGNLRVVVPVYVHDEIGFLSSSFNRMVQSVFESETELAEALEFQAKLTSSYSHFVPKQLLTLLDRRSIIDIKLGDNIERNMTILFSDIRSFTSLSEKMTPEENFNFINNFLKRVGPIVRKHNGYIDKYIGDGIMALFPETPQNAVAASVEMQAVGQEYNRYLRNLGRDPIRFGIGAHTGVVMLGTIGEEKRMEGTVISDAVNLAARLEGLTKRYDAAVIVSRDTLAYIRESDEFCHRYLDRVQVKGKLKWVDIFEILDALPQQEMEIRRRTKRNFERATTFYFQKRLTEAADLFRAVLETDPGDRAAALYLDRCRHFFHDGIPPEWEGVSSIGEK